VQPIIWTMWGRSRTMHPKDCAQFTGGCCLCEQWPCGYCNCRFRFALYFMFDKIEQSPWSKSVNPSISDGLVSLLTNQKVHQSCYHCNLSMAVWCGIAASHWQWTRYLSSGHPNAYDRMSGILNQGQYLRFHLLVMRMNRVQTLKPISGRWNMTLQQFETIHQMWW